MTISQLVPGGLDFNAVAILNYDGFLSILKVLGGVDMCVDEEVWSIHYDRNGKKVYPTCPMASASTTRSGATTCRTGRRSTSPGNGTSPTATTVGSGTSSSSSRRSSRR